MRWASRTTCIEPENGDAHNGRGYARVRLGHYRDGIQDSQPRVAEFFTTSPGSTARTQCPDVALMTELILTSP
jgi:hypothetical protein